MIRSRRRPIPTPPSWWRFLFAYGTWSAQVIHVVEQQARPCRQQSFATIASGSAILIAPAEDDYV